MTRPLSLVLLLDRLQDPGNMGTIVRTASAAGVDALFYGPGTVDPVSYTHLDVYKRQGSGGEEAQLVPSKKFVMF